jgi:ribosomal protein S18 acetylase RimI-like enzyme
MIRSTTPADTPALLELTAATGVFKPHEVDTLRDVLADYHETNVSYEHVAVTSERNGQVVGFAYYAPEPMTDRTWYLYWIAVDPRIHRKGLGAELMRHVETDVKARRGRLLLIETSSTPLYDPTRRFYEKFGYAVAAVLRDYYRDGDDMVVFGKRLE